MTSPTVKAPNSPQNPTTPAGQVGGEEMESRQENKRVHPQVKRRVKVVKRTDPACFYRGSFILVLQGFSASAAYNWIELSKMDTRQYGAMIPIIFVQDPTHSSESELEDLNIIGARIVSRKELDGYLRAIKPYSPPKPTEPSPRKKMTEEQAEWEDFIHVMNTSW